MRAKTAIAAAWIAIASVLPAGGQEQAEYWTVERLERTWRIPGSAVVRLDNPWGDVAVRTQAASEVYLLAHVQRHREDPREFELTADTSETGLALAVGFAGAPGVAVSEAWAKRRVDVTVFVPEAAATRFSTGSGTLEIRGTRGPTEAETETGDLRLRVAGPVTARTRHGDVLTQFLRTDWKRPVEVSSVTGAIRVEMPRGGNAEVVIETRGEITSDYSTHVEWLEGSLLKRARLSVGTGGLPLKLTSQQGSIKILQSLVPTEDDPAEENGDPTP